ncbi:MAG TPA: YicC/YloC family endoribonuclease [Candidatus Binatia bacterium]|nr:YicC/YloC family endoribonuclease [Candidatus Binatia bacterium]
MTGYGAGAADAAGVRVTVEVRGVNQRFLDVKVSMPREYASCEAEIRERVRALARRGRVEVGVGRTPLAAQRRYRVAVRHQLARAYVEATRDLARALGLEGTVTLAEVMRLPDLFEVSEPAPDVRAELPALRRALRAALRAFESERRREGRHLQRDMQARTAAVRRAAARMRATAPRVTALLRRQVEERLARLLGGQLDAARLTHEVALLAERGDFTEELVRLDGHLAALAAALRAPGPVGKRIDFLLQEVHRELNTAGAKAQDLAIGALVLEARGEVEKLREQVQNVE